MPLISSHLCFANDQLSDCSVNENQYNGFLIGNILPDIHYISGDSREITHFPLKDEIELFKQIDIVKKENSNLTDIAIKTGIAFHSFIDIWWRKQVYLASTSRFIGLALQIVDEEQSFLLLDRKTAIERIKKLKVNNFLNIPEVVIERWILLVINYLSQNQFDTKKTIKLIASGKNYDSETVEKILALVDFIKSDKKTLNQITKLNELGVPQKIKFYINNLWLS